MKKYYNIILSLTILSLMNVGWGLEFENEVLQYDGIHTLNNDIYVDNSDIALNRDELEIINSYTWAEEFYVFGIAKIDDIIYFVEGHEYRLKSYNLNTGEVNILFDTAGHYGLVWDGEYFWVGNYGVIYGYDFDGNQVGSISLPFTDYPSITFNGEHFIVAPYYQHINTIYEMDHSGNIIKEYSSVDFPSGVRQYGLCWASEHTDGNLWMQGYTSESFIFRVNLDDNGSFELVDTFDSPAEWAHGSFVHDGTDLWIDDGYTGGGATTLYQLDDGIFESWLNASPAFGTIPADSTQSIEVIFDATTLFGGDYSANIIILTNIN